jgi:hypothetical protein
VTRGLLVVTLALVLAVPAMAATSARQFRGRTVEDMPISFRLSADGRRIDHIALGFYAFCDEDVAFAQTGRRDAPAPVAADGRFAVRVGTSITLRGRISGRRATGTLDIRIGVGREACVWPNVGWSARG